MLKFGRNGERKKRKSLFSTTPLTFDASPPANHCEHPQNKPYLARNQDPWVTFLSLIVFGSIFIRILVVAPKDVCNVTVVTERIMTVQINSGSVSQGR